MTKLKTVALTKRYSGLVAVNDLSFSMEAGEILGIIGPNGAGKTTFIDLVSGIQPPSSGTIEYRGRDITWTPAHERARAGIARTYQLIHPLENLSLIENVMVGSIFARGHTVKAARGRAEAICGSLDLGGFSRSTAQLTILETKKMEIARALANEPQVLFLDEVMAGLNAEETLELIGRIQAIAAESGLAIGVVEHVMGVIRQLTHRVIVLEAGELIAEGPYAEVAKNPRVIAAYLGGAE